MKKIKTWALVLIGIMMGSCTSSDDASDVQSQMGSIYGIVTELGTAEPMKAVGVELYKGKYHTNKGYDYGENSLILKTVTFDDGHFEFKDLVTDKFTSYTVRIVADGYEQIEDGSVTVEAGRQARVDLQVKKIDTKVVVSTQEATVNGNEVLFTAEFTYNSGYYPSEVGFVYSTQDNPSNDGTIVKCKKEEIEETSSTYTKTFSTKVSGLGKGTYYVKAYTINSIGKTFGEVRSFSLSFPPAVTTLAPTNILAETATLNGRIDAEGDPAYTERGFVYSKSYSMPTVDDPVNATTKVPVSGRSKDFSANISSLTEDVKYYVRTYVKNEDGTYYGEVKTFIPSHPLPSVVTLSVTNILETSATLNGRIESPGDPAYTERGFLYSKSHEVPTINDASTSTVKVVVAGTNKDFEANISSLTKGTKYYARAYATSSKGTAYGEVVSFTTDDKSEYIILGNLMIQKQDLGSGNWGTAKEMCTNSRIGGYSDWRLPTIAELSVIYTHRVEIGGFVETGRYWSSTLSGSYYYYLEFSNGEQHTCPYSYDRYVRAVRTKQ
ncbi:MAG: DUF1566 domain-containing protein [Prevotella sp.]|nr:DUF1566 domain-containing protein [Prevotella sp.]